MNAPPDVVGRVAAVLRAVTTAEPHGTTTAAAARATAVPRPTAHRLLSSLMGAGLVDRDAAGRWHLGPEAYLLGTAAAARYDVSAVAHPVVRRLAQATQESAFLSVRRGDETVCLIREDGSFPIRSHVLHVGIRLPLGVASAGLAVLAHLADAEVEDYLAGAGLEREHGPQHAADAVRERVWATRELGYAVNPGLIVAGSWGLGAAVFDAAGRPQWALSLTGIEQRFEPPRRHELGTLLLRAAHELSSSLRRRDPDG